MKEEERKERTQKKVTRKDIADLAGVSVSVVSRALNNSGYVKKEVKEKILKIAKEMDYVPNPVAMSLQQRRTKQILFYCKDIHNAFYIDLYHGMIREARQRDYMVLLNGNLNFQRLRETMIDGIILQSEGLAVEFNRICGKNYYLPAVVAGYGSRLHMDRSIPVVEWDLYQGMEIAIAYLMKNGHKKIAYAGPNISEYTDARETAWFSMMQPYLEKSIDDYYLGIGYQEFRDYENFTEYEADFKAVQAEKNEAFFEEGIIAAGLLLKRKLDATAVICFNDEFAFGMFQELRRSRVKIPDDISLISFDGCYRRRYVYPELTCITGNPEYQGEILAKTLIDQIEGKPIHYMTTLPSKLLEGGTVRKLNG